MPVLEALNDSMTDAIFVMSLFHSLGYEASLVVVAVSRAFSKVSQCSFADVYQDDPFNALHLYTAVLPLRYADEEWEEEWQRSKDEGRGNKLYPNTERVNHNLKLCFPTMQRSYHL